MVHSLASKSVPVDGSEPIDIILVHSLHFVRAALAQLISQESSMKIVGQAASSSEAIEVMAAMTLENSALALVGLPLEGDHDAYSLIKWINLHAESCTVIGFGANATPSQVANALVAGSYGFIDQNALPNEVVHALSRAAGGERVFVGPSITALPEIYRTMDELRNNVAILTAREHEVLRAAAQGMSAREIGLKLSVRERTVTTHLSRIYSKLGVTSKLAAIAAARNRGLEGFSA
ncbi:MAG: response regulator transcription factor [Actinobacteria bacterium]|nr:response regulator transcription factor [Actinomycetota bacterium]